MSSNTSSEASSDKASISQKRTSNWKTRIETGFYNLGLVIAKHPLSWFLSFILAVGLIGTQLAHIRVDASVEGFLEEGAAEITNYNEFKALFGRDEVYLIDIEIDDIFQQDFVDNLRALHMQLEDEVPYADNVESLITARHTFGADDTLYIEEILPEKLPTDPVELQKLKDYTYDNHTYVNYLISRDRKLTSIAVRLVSFLYEEDENGVVQQKYLEGQEKRESMDKITEILEQHQSKFTGKIYMSGSTPVSLLIEGVTQRDFGVFTGLAILVITILLYIIFRRVSGVVMPLVVMLLGIIVTISMMAAMDTPIQVSTSILPSFLLAVCVGDSIHLLTIFYRRYDGGEEKHIALANALEHTGLAIFFTSITTAAGLASFATSNLAPVSALGLYGAIGSLLAFVLTVTILPCLIALLPIKRRPIKEDTGSVLQKFLLWCAEFSIANAKAVTVIGMIIFVGALAIASQSKYSHHPIEWLPQDEPALISLKNHEARMGSSLTMEVVIDTGKERGVNNAAFMKKLDKAVKEIETWETETYSVVKVMSVADIIKESNRALHDNDEAFYVIPDESDLISQELFLVELDKPDDLFNMIDRRYQKARITVMIPWVDALYMRPLITRIENYLNEQLKDEAEEVIMTGIFIILGATFSEILFSTAQSYGFAVIAITFMMILLIGSLRLGLISMIPSLLPILISLSCLVLLDIPLDILTMLIGSIAIGLTVDDNVHFMHGFRRVYRETGDPERAVKETLATTGRAMLITSIVLSMGFFVYTQAQMNNIVVFGASTALCIVLALVATFILAPALMVLSNKKQAVN